MLSVARWSAETLQHLLALFSNQPSNPPQPEQLPECYLSDYKSPQDQHALWDHSPHDNQAYA